VQIETCGLSEGYRLYWWEAAGQVWRLVTDHSYAAGCLTAAVTETSSPSLAQLSGTYFAVGGEAVPVVQLSSTHNPAEYGQTLTLTALVSGGYGLPTGVVTFSDGGNVLPGCEEVALEDGQAQCILPLLAVGIHALRAEYRGDGVYRSGSGTLEQAVIKADAVLHLPDLVFNYDGTDKKAALVTDPPDLPGTSITYNGEALPPLDAGIYAVLAVLDNPSYQAEPVTATLTILPLTLTVTADDKGREYLEPDPAFTVTYSGFAGGEGEEVLEGAPLLSTTAAPDSPAGSYPILIEIGTLSARNYIFDLIPGTLTIGPTDQEISFDPLTDRTFGEPDFPVSAVATSGLAVTFTAGADDACTVSGSLVHILRAGTCTITAHQEGDANFRPAIPVPQTFTIHQAPAIILLSDLTQEYDGAPKAVTAATDPEGVSLRITYDGSPELPFRAGSYLVAAEINDPNYVGQPVELFFTITPRPITAAADMQSKVYGAADPLLTFTVTSGSLVDGDSFSGALTRDPGEDVGLYTIRQGSLTAGDNYDLSFIEASLNIQSKALTVKAEDKQRQYSDPDPAFTVTYHGFVEGEGVEVLSGEPSLSTTAGQYSPVGGYPINVAQGTLFARNYAFEFVPGVLTIVPEQANLTYTGDMQVTTPKANAKATVTLAASLEEELDGWPGSHLGGQQVLFEVFGFGDLTYSSPVASCTADIGGVVNGRGFGSCTVSLGASDPYSIRVRLVDNPYYTAQEDAAAVLVNDPGTGMTAGGGWLLDPNTGGRVNFGFTAKFLKNGKVQGNSLFIYRVALDLSTINPAAPEGVRDYSILIKSNAMTGLNIYNCPKDALSGCQATISGKNNIQARDRLTGELYDVGGNYQFQVDVTDNREGSSPPTAPADLYAIRVWNASGQYYELGDAYSDRGALTNPLPISGGNIQVKAAK
jgi:hypothetical protein